MIKWKASWWKFGISRSGKLRRATTKALYDLFFNSGLGISDAKNILFNRLPTLSISRCGKSDSPRYSSRVLNWIHLKSKWEVWSAWNACFGKSHVLRLSQNGVNTSTNKSLRTLLSLSIQSSVSKWIKDASLTKSLLQTVSGLRI